MLTLLIFVALLLILLILIQKGRGGGLSGAFGGSGGGSAAFGAKTGDVLTWATSTVFGLFILLAVLLDLVVNSQFKSPVQNCHHRGWNLTGGSDHQHGHQHGSRHNTPPRRTRAGNHRAADRPETHRFRTRPRRLLGRFNAATQK